MHSQTHTDRAHKFKLGSHRQGQVDHAVTLKSRPQDSRFAEKNLRGNESFRGKKIDQLRGLKYDVPDSIISGGSVDKWISTHPSPSVRQQMINTYSDGMRKQGADQPSSSVGGLAQTNVPADAAVRDEIVNYRATARDIKARLEEVRPDQRADLYKLAEEYEMAADDLQRKIDPFYELNKTMKALAEKMGNEPKTNPYAYDPEQLVEMVKQYDDKKAEQMAKSLERRLAQDEEIKKRTEENAKAEAKAKAAALRSGAIEAKGISLKEMERQLEDPERFAGILNDVYGRKLEKLSNGDMDALNSRLEREAADENGKIDFAAIVTWYAKILKMKRADFVRQLYGELQKRIDDSESKSVDESGDESGTAPLSRRSSLDESESKILQKYNEDEELFRFAGINSEDDLFNKFKNGSDFDQMMKILNIEMETAKSIKKKYKDVFKRIPENYSEEKVDRFKDMFFEMLPEFINQSNTDTIDIALRIDKILTDQDKKSKGSQNIDIKEEDKEEKLSPNDVRKKYGASTDQKDIMFNLRTLIPSLKVGGLLNLVSNATGPLPNDKNERDKTIQNSFAAIKYEDFGRTMVSSQDKNEKSRVINTLKYIIHIRANAPDVKLSLNDIEYIYRNFGGLRKSWSENLIRVHSWAKEKGYKGDGVKWPRKTPDEWIGELYNDKSEYDARNKDNEEAAYDALKKTYMEGVGSKKSV